MLSKGSPVNPGNALCLSRKLGGSKVRPTPKRTRFLGIEGSAPGKRNNPRPGVTGHQGKLEVTATGRRGVLRPHSTDEGGEPQGSGKGRPRYPSEGRGEQLDVPS